MEFRNYGQLKAFKNHIIGLYKKIFGLVDIESYFGLRKLNNKVLRNGLMNLKYP
jgi:hypothetical protein